MDYLPFYQPPFTTDHYHPNPTHLILPPAIGGNNVNAIAADPSLLDDIRGNRAEILLLDDGFGNASPDDPPLYSPCAGGAHPLFDAGPVSLNKLAAWVNKADIIFWVSC